MPEAYETGVAPTNDPYTIKEVVDAFVAFIQTNDPGAATWLIQKGATGAPYGDTWNTTYGTDGDPLIIGKTNGTAAEDFIIHIWENGRRNLSFNLSGGPFNRAVGTNWWDEPNARYGRATSDFTRKRENVCQMYYSTMTTMLVEQYHFFMFNNMLWCVYKQTNGVWRNFGFGHMEKIASFVGGAFVCCSYDSVYGANRENSNDAHNVMFIDMHGNSASVSTNDNWHVPHFRCDTQQGDFRYGCGMYMANYLDVGAEDNDLWLGDNDTAGSNGNMFSNIDNRLACFEYDKMRSTSTFGLTAPLIPVYFYIGRERKSENWSLVGKLDDIFGMNILNFAETSVTQIQGNDYLVFPRARKTTLDDTGDGVPNSYQYGFVIRRPV